MAQIPPWSVLLVVVGVPLLVWPRRVTTAYEVVDAIGRRPAGPVEPSGWYVTLTRLGGGAFVVVGGAVILGAVL